MISFLLAPIFWLILAQLGVGAQLVPPTWRKPNITTSAADRIRIAGAAVEQSLGNIGADGDFTDDQHGDHATDGLDGASPFYGQMAEFDIATGQRRYEDTIQKYLARTQETARFNFSDDKHYGRTAARAYSAYRTQIFLDYAIQAWWFGRRFTLTLENVNSGKTNVKNSPITKMCNGRSMAGGTFWSNDTTDLDIAALPTGNFLILSALLAEATTDKMYLQAAFDTAEFIHAHLYTDSHDVQNGMLNDLITAIPDTIWLQGDGVLDKDHFDYTSNLVKGLGVAYARNVTSPDLRNWMQACIWVQFNAVIDLSTNGNNIYAYTWHGPPVDTFDKVAQTDAINVLLSALSVGDISQPSSLTSVSPSHTGTLLPDPSTPASSGKLSMTGPIVGGVIGGIALLSSIFFVFWRLQRRRLRRNDAFTTPVVTPMVIALYTEHPSSRPLSILSPRRAKINTAALSQAPPSGDRLDGAAPEEEAESARNTHPENSGDQLDGAVPGGEAESARNTHRENQDVQSVDIPTAQLVQLLRQRL
ncbi:hypothetical protein C8J57DRAFT_1714017 [Mycena rebaudengoi]|nr:hypothetical protein C8J57DRAFT_1714017 [Mycena rebaudengoi]